MYKIIEGLGKDDAGQYRIGPRASQFLERQVMFPERMRERQLMVEEPSPLHTQALQRHLIIGGTCDLGAEEAQPVFDKAFDNVRSLRLPKRTIAFEYCVFWDHLDFQQEKSLRGLRNSEVCLQASAYTLDPSKTRFEANGTFHELKLDYSKGDLHIEAEGMYCSKLDDIIRIARPQVAQLHLTKTDASRLINRARHNEAPNDFIARLEAGLQPKVLPALRMTDKGIEHISIETIDVLVPAGYIGIIQEIVGQPILDAYPGQETRVTGLLRHYGLFGTLAGRALRDMKAMAMEVESLDFGVLYDHSLLTNSYAKENIDKEIAQIRELYGRSVEEVAMLGPQWLIQRGDIVQQLALDKLGKEVLADFNDSSVEEYVSSLAQMGYVRQDIGADDGGFGFVTKERHLFEFFVQSFEKDPAKSILGLQEVYTNRRPDINIYANYAVDAAMAGKVRIPEKSKVYAFRMMQNPGVSDCHNALALSRDQVDDPEVVFCVRASIDSPLLLPAQEYVCTALGVSFR